MLRWLTALQWCAQLLPPAQLPGKTFEHLQGEHLCLMRCTCVCRVMFLISYLAGITAIALLWFVYPRDFNYGQATGDSLQFMDAMKVRLAAPGLMAVLPHMLLL